MLLAEICLYGNMEVGAGWLVRTHDYKSGDVRIFAPGGRKMAEMPVQSFRYYGAIKWKAAPVLEISAEDIERASVA
jgi:hypothetical protein